MLECTYTKDKVKKSKSWKDGYIILRDNKIHLYDEDRKKIYASNYTYLSEEITLPMYLIYCEKINKNEESEEEVVRPEKKLVKRQVKNLHPPTTVKKYISPVKKKMENVKERITDDGIILIDDGSDAWTQPKASPRKQVVQKKVGENIFMRTREDILKIMKEIE